MKHRFIEVTDNGIKVLINPDKILCIHPSEDGKALLSIEGKMHWLALDESYEAIRERLVDRWATNLGEDNAAHGGDS